MLRNEYRFERQLTADRAPTAGDCNRLAARVAPDRRRVGRGRRLHRPSRRHRRIRTTAAQGTQWKSVKAKGTRAEEVAHGSIWPAGVGIFERSRS